MTIRKNFSIRILCMILVSFILVNSISLSYYHSVHATGFEEGIVATVGLAPTLTWLLIGGCVVAGGIALYELSQTDAEDHSNFLNGLKTGFNQFVAEQEKQIALEQDSSLSDQEASDIGVANAREMVNEFYHNSVESIGNIPNRIYKVTDINQKTFEYWKLYNAIIGDVADNGLGEYEEITPTTVIDVPVSDSFGHTFVADDNVGANLTQYGDYYYISGGKTIRNGTRYDFGNDGRPRYITWDASDQNFSLWSIDATNNTEVMWGYWRGNSLDIMEGVISGSNFPVFYIGETVEQEQQFHNNMKNNWREILKIVGAGSAVGGGLWRNTIHDMLNNTHIGQSIKKGRLDRVQNGDWIGSVFAEDSIPVHKTGITVNDGVATGEIGWSVPDAQTWDDVLNGTKPYGDVVGKTGTINVPKGRVTDYPQDGTAVDYPTDTPVQDSADYPDDPAIPDDEPTEIPEKPFQEVIEDWGGSSYYPSAMDLTQLFPFCIPFDIIYLFEKFDVQGANAPVITIPIVYPNTIKGVMGSDSYEVVIDFEDFIILRNILRIFILIAFIFGLMRITRELIRG